MKKLYILFLFSLFILGSRSSFAQGDLLITPTRIIFEGNKQKETLNLVNTGQDTASYSISFLQYNMNEDGSFSEVDWMATDQMFADPYLRIFPRRVTLAPGEPQAIMLQYRRKADMLTGEYRSHLYFRSEKNVSPLGAKGAKDDTKLQVNLVPIFGLSIPIIIRVGEQNVSASLSDLELVSRPEGKFLFLTLNRSGNISLYGDIRIIFYPTRGRSFEVGTVKGLGVYTNINKRKIIVKLEQLEGKSLSNGMLMVEFVSSKGRKENVLAKSELRIN
jgi:hypothetical protein